MSCVSHSVRCLKGPVFTGCVGDKTGKVGEGQKHWQQEEMKKETKICIEMNENENTTTKNLWDTVKAVLRGWFIALQAYLKKQEKSQINNLTLHLRQLEKEEMKNPRVSRKKEILKIRAEINAKKLKRP